MKRIKVVSQYLLINKMNFSRIKSFLILITPFKKYSIWNFIEDKFPTAGLFRLNRSWHDR